MAEWIATIPLERGEFHPDATEFIIGANAVMRLAKSRQATSRYGDGRLLAA
jgi:hypothetical protein